MSAPARPKSRRAQVASAEKILHSLLRTPKTRAGLIAAVTSQKISRNFVYGWLARQINTGEVAELKSTSPPMFQLSVRVLRENSCAGTYPAWLEPRNLPEVTSRRVFTAGQPI